MTQPLFLIRHAAVQLDLALPAEHWELSIEGRGLAERLAALPIFADLQAVWSSPEPKAQATARPLAHRSGGALLVHPNLAELQRGPSNLPQREAYEAAVREAFAHPDTSVGGWERARDAQRRIVAGIHEIAAQAHGPIAVVSHGLVLSLLVAHLGGASQVSVAEWRAITLPALAVVDRRRWQLVAPFQSVETWERDLSNVNFN